MNGFKKTLLFLTGFAIGLWLCEQLFPFAGATPTDPDINLYLVLGGGAATIAYVLIQAIKEVV